MTCPQCGNQATPSERFCTRCGAPLGAVEGSAPPSPEDRTVRSRSGSAVAPITWVVVAVLVCVVLAILVATLILSSGG